MKNGSLNYQGYTGDVIDKYLSDGSETERCIEWPAENRPSSSELEVISIKIFDSKGRLDSSLATSDEIKIEIEYIIKTDLKDLRVVINLFTSDGTEVISSSDFHVQPSSRVRKPGHYKSVCIIPGSLLNLGTYLATIDFDIPKVKALVMDLPMAFTISELSFNQLGITIANRPAGVVHPLLNWDILTQ
jgi:hypothetical protein